MGDAAAAATPPRSTTAHSAALPSSAAAAEATPWRPAERSGEPIDVRSIRALIALAVAAAALMGLAAWVVGSEAERAARSQLEAALRADARLVSVLLADPTGAVPAFEAQRAKSLRDVARRASGALEVRVAFLDATGALVADSRELPAGPGDASSFPALSEVRTALRGEIALVDDRTGAGRVAPLLKLAAPHPLGASRGVIWLAADSGPVLAAGGAVRRAAGLAGAVLLGVTVGAAWLGMRRHAAQMGLVAEAAEALLGGDQRARRPRGLRGLERMLRRTRDALQSRHARVLAELEELRSVVREVDFGVVVLSAEGRIMLASRGLRELFEVDGVLEGYTPLEVLRNAELDRVLSRALRSSIDTSTRGEVRIGTATARQVEVRAHRVVTENGACVVAVLDDRTELRRLERVRRDFVANASHELRTPLTAIRGFAEILADNDVSRETEVQYLRIIVQHSERLAKLADDLLSLSTVEGGAMALKIEPIDLAQAVDRVLRSLDPLFSKCQVTARRAFDAAPRARADARLLEQVLTNLVENAAKYNESGGSISVQAAACPEGVRVLIVDTGIGIPAADRRRIFERFYRVDKAHSRARGGTGLGLAIVRNGVEAMGGEVGVDSTPGKGSTFYFTLPAASGVTLPAASGVSGARKV